MVERRRFNYVRAVRITAFVIIPAVLMSTLLVYLKLYGVRQALQELVRTQTDNQYRLEIGKTEISIRSLTLKFEKATITRVETDTSSGVSSVTIPSFELRLGSMASLFGKELDISLLSVDEPSVIIESGNHHVERSMITRQIIDLYPIIEAVLARFNIGSLKISKATLAFLEKDENIFSVRYVDLSIENWRMRDLSSTSQLKINIEKQNFNLGKANLNFSGIEYNYLKHHLVFNDFSVSLADSASGSNISISGRALKLQHLDYRELYNHQRYNLKRAEIVEPIINAQFQWKKGRRSRDINRNIVTRMVKQTFGECNLDSAIVSRARVHVEMRQANDTASIDLPRVDFRLHTFAVTRDSANFQIGEMQVNLNGSALSLPGNWSVALDEVLYDRHRDLTLSHITIRHALEPTPVATLSTLRVRYFNLIGLIFQKRFSASTIYAEGGHVDLQRFFRTSESSDSVLRPPDVIVQTLSLKDIDLSYRSKKANIEVEGVSFRATNIRTDQAGTVRYALKSVWADRAVIHVPAMRTRATLQGVAFNGEKLNARRAEASRDSLTVVAENFETALPATAQKIRSLKYISADRLILQGKVPQATQSLQKPTDSFILNELNFGVVQAKLSAGTLSIEFGARNIRTDRWQFGKDLAWPRRISGELSDLVVNSPNGTARAAGLRVDYPRQLTGHNINYAGPKVAVTATAIMIRHPQYQHHWLIDRLSLQGVQFKTRSRAALADSVIVVAATWDANTPGAERIDVFNPTVSVGATQEKDGPSPRLIDALPAHHVYFHPGEITLGNERKIEFGLLHIDRERRTLHASYLSTPFAKSNVMARNILLEPDRVTADSILIIPNRKWYSSLVVEETLIQAKFSNVTVRHFSLERLVRHRTKSKLDIDIGYADFDLRRNKLLPDPPPHKKPVTLDGLIPLPSNVQVSTINIHDGRIQYRQLSDRTGEEGYVMMDKIIATSRFDSLSSFLSLHAKTNLYQSGKVQLDYTTLSKDKFELNVRVNDMDLTKLNQIVMPLQSLRIKSGYLKEYRLSVHADDDAATGDAAITYEGLHLELFKHNDPERRNLATEVLTLLADGLILKHSKENARSAVTTPRVKYKSVFHYWVTSTITGATTAIRKGKKTR